MKLNRRGFTLVEMVVYAGLIGIVILAIGSAMVLNVQSYFGSVSHIDTEESLTRVEALLRRVIRQGLRVQLLAGAPPAAPATDGWIRAFNGSAFANLNWGLFYREASRGDIAPAVSQPQLTGLFWIAPSVVGTVEYPGAILVDLDTNQDAQVNYHYGDAYVSNLVNVVVQPTPNSVTQAFNGTQRLLSLEIQFTVRYFPVNRLASKRCYRPAGCSGDMAGRDEVRTISILLRDNEFDRSPLSGTFNERGLGPIYFFQDTGGQKTL